MLKAPFVYFGGKARVACKVWSALGNPRHYIEPFFGSGAVLLNRPEPHEQCETVNDKDGFVANVWRAIQLDPDGVSRWSDWPVNHADLIARKKTLIANEARLLEGLCADPKWFDAELAGYWIWAASCWIGSGLTRPGQIPHLSNAGQGVHGKIPHLHNPNGQWVNTSTNVHEWMQQLAARLRRVRVVCGDLSRVCGGNWQDKFGDCGIFFDPPYSDESRDNDIYHAESMTVAHDVREWALERGKLPSYRIVLAGYFDEHKSLLEHGWRHEMWKSSGGYGNIAKGETAVKKNRHKECLFYSPFCIENQKELGL
jgi:DNA adenine methylase